VGGRRPGDKKHMNQKKHLGKNKRSKGTEQKVFGYGTHGGIEVGAIHYSLGKRQRNHKNRKKGKGNGSKKKCHARRGKESWKRLNKKGDMSTRKWGGEKKRS